MGILNGIDYGLWDPAKDPMLPAKYDAQHLEKKKINKQAMLKEYGLPERGDVPVFGLVTRLADQKGFDILGEALPKLLDGTSQWIILGTGDPQYHTLLTDLNNDHPELLGIALRFDAKLAQHIYAGSDFFVMPSRYEPCGLGQLIGFKYGTIPVVRKTGGLADTVVDIAEAPLQGSGFVFEEYSAQVLEETIRKAIAFYSSPEARTTVAQRIMNLDYSWRVSAHHYLDLYSRSLLKHPATAAL